MNLDVKNKPLRSVCVSCARKKERQHMVKHGQHWTCKGCLSGTVVAQLGTRDHRKISVLNCYAGIGGNRKLWPANVAVTAIELNPKVAAAYQELYPEDVVICGNAHEYLLKNFHKFDLIWSSSPCQSHSRMNYWTSEGKKNTPICLYMKKLYY